MTCAFLYLLVELSSVFMCWKKKTKQTIKKKKNMNMEIKLSEKNPETRAVKCFILLISVRSRRETNMHSLPLCLLHTPLSLSLPFSLTFTHTHTQKCNLKHVHTHIHFLSHTHTYTHTHMEDADPSYLLWYCSCRTSKTTSQASHFHSLLLS